MLKFVILESANDADPKQLASRQSSVRIGRHPSNDIVLSNPAVSNYHGEIRNAAEGPVYRDLQSTNGSVVRRGSKLLRLDGQLHRIDIEDGDVLLLGFLDKPVLVQIQIVEDDATEDGTLPLSEVDRELPVEATLDIAESLQATQQHTLAALGAAADRSALIALHRFSNVATGERDLRRLLGQFASSTLDAIKKADRLSVYLKEADSDDFQPAYAQTRSAEIRPEPLSRTLRKMVFDRGEAVLFSISDPALDDSESLFNADIVSGLCAPIWNGDRVIGLALVDSQRKHSPPLTLEDLTCFTLLAHQAALCIDNAQLTTGLVKTVDELTSIQAEMQQLAFFDPLTGLHNRRLFLDRLEQAVRTGRRTPQRLAVLYLDLDHFKEINDTLGHGVGDTLLCTVGDRLLGCVRNEDTVARLGGDEFAVLMTDIIGIEGPKVVAEKILNELRKPIEIEEHALHVTASIGITIAPADGESADTLLKNADLALYRAKGRGRDTFQFFVDDMNKEIADRLFVQRELWTSLELGQFVQHFQPIWQLHDTKPVGAEALTRWQHPHRGLLLPEHFIGLAEESELIVRIGEWTIESACSYLADLQRVAHEHVRIAINLSARQFQGGLVDVFQRAIQQSGIDASGLEVEITETLLMDNVDETRVALEQLKNLGITIAIDDFGTGYCSLSYLKDLPIDILKVDPSFVQRIETSDKHAEIVAAVIAMAHKLQMKVVAEGIETEGQLRFLVANGCDLGQGFLLCKPVPFDVFAELVCPDERIEHGETIY